jgi:hypothetical protein
MERGSLQPEDVSLQVMSRNSVSIRVVKCAHARLLRHLSVDASSVVGVPEGLMDTAVFELDLQLPGYVSGYVEQEPVLSGELHLEWTLAKAPG